MTDLIGNNLKINDPSGNRTVSLYGETANLRLGGKKADGTDGNAGDIILFPQDGDHAEAKTATILLNGEHGKVKLQKFKPWLLPGNIPASPPPGGITVSPFVPKNVIEIDAGKPSITLKGSGLGEILIDDSTVRMKNTSGESTISLYAESANLRLGGKKANGENGNAGDIFLFPKHGDHAEKDATTATIHLDGEHGKVKLQKDSKTTIHLDAGAGNIRLGGNGTDGDLLLFPQSADDINKDAQARIWLDADQGNLALGGNGQDGDILLFPKSATISTTDLTQATIHLDGDAGNITVKGDITLKNADCAEDFDVSVLAAAEPGTVMVLGEEGSLCQSTEAYDKKVAGVVSGAGDLKPGLILDKQSESTNRMPIALMGKVYCKVDAQYAPIEVGDLLTTSPTSGHAMKATDPLKAFGTIIGKALKSLDAGTGLIPILVALQ